MNNNHTVYVIFNAEHDTGDIKFKTLLLKKKKIQINCFEILSSVAEHKRETKYIYINILIFGESSILSQMLDGSLQINAIGAVKSMNSGDMALANSKIEKLNNYLQ